MAFDTNLLRTADHNELDVRKVSGSNVDWLEPAACLV